jgi:hypothetical protein
MIGYYLKLFSLVPGATFDEVKDAYRKLVKKHHPDLFQDEDMKKVQEIRMVQINEAYSRLQEEFRDMEKEVDGSGTLEKPVKDMPYKIYKEGIDHYFSAVIRKPRKTGVTLSRKKGLRFWLMEPMKQQEVLEHYKESLKNLRLAETAFSRLLKKYPESTWAPDAHDKLDMIGKLYQVYQSVIGNAGDFQSMYARLSDFDAPVRFGFGKK